MAITVKHSKVSSIPDDADTSLVRPSDWNADHTLVGLGTMAEQDANNVAITGGTINGTTIGATTASTGAFTYLSTSSSTSTTPTLSYNASNSAFVNGATVSGSYLQNVMQNKSGTAGASTNFAVSNDLGTDSTYYGEFGMNSSVFSSGTPSDFFSLNNGIYFSGHDGDMTLGSGNGYKTFLAWGTVGQSAHVINASGALGLNTNITGTSNFGTSGQLMQSAGSAATPTWSSALSGLTIDNSVIGGTTQAAGTFTTLTSTGTATFANASTTYVTVTGDASYPMIKATGGTNTPLVLSPLGTGALQAQKTDSTATGGNARGANAVDWQTTRTAASQVASGTASVISGGYQNTSSGNYNVIGGGQGNQATSSYGGVGSGASNTLSANFSFIGGGTSNSITNGATSNYSFIGAGASNASHGVYNFVGGGFTNSGTVAAAATSQSATMNGTTAVTLSGSNANIKVGQYIGGTSIAGDTYVAAISGTALTLSKVASGSSTSTLSFYTPHGVVVGGGNNQATGSYSFIGGGGDAGTSTNRNTASGDWSAILGGRGGTTRGITGFQAFPACSIPIASGAGYSQAGLLVLGKQTTDATATVITSDGLTASTSNQVILPNNSAYYFTGEVISGVTGGGDSKGWTISGVIKRGANAAATTLVGSTVTSLYADAGAATWTVALAADTTNGGLKVTFTGQAATTIRTVCQIRTTETTY